MTAINDTRLRGPIKRTPIPRTVDVAVDEIDQAIRLLRESGVEGTHPAPGSPNGMRSAVLAWLVDLRAGSGSQRECDECFGSGSKTNVPVHVECPGCGGTGVKNGS